MAKTITMTETFKTGKVYFLHHHSYEYDEIFRLRTSVSHCGSGECIMKHYRVAVDGLAYYIPEDVCVVLDASESITEGQENKTKYYEDKLYETPITENGKTDIVKASKQYLGINIAAKERMDKADHNGEWIMKKIKERWPNG